VTYIATFFSHFGATRFVRKLRELGIDGVSIPVPRKLSSSCGTCVRFTYDGPPQEMVDEEVDKIFLVEGGENRLVVDNND